MSSHRQFASPLWENIRSECLPEIDASTVPIYGLQDDEQRHGWTGVLYRIVDQYFILTAAHDLRGAVQHGIPLYVPSRDPGREPIPLLACQFHTTEESDGRDVAAIHLDRATVEALLLERSFIAHRDVRQGYSGDGPFVVFGYPAAWSEAHRSGSAAECDPFIYMTLRHTGEQHSGSFYDPQVNIELGYSPAAIEVGTGESETMPALSGISGCGIWLMSNTGQRANLIATQHRWMYPSTGHYLQGTWISYVLELIG